MNALRDRGFESIISSSPGIQFVSRPSATGSSKIGFHRKVQTTSAPLMDRQAPLQGASGGGLALLKPSADINGESVRYKLACKPCDGGLKFLKISRPSLRVMEHEEQAWPVVASGTFHHLFTPPST